MDKDLNADQLALVKLLGIRLPIIQAGMVWTSGWRLASAVSNTGALGLIGAGSMTPELLEQHILKACAATNFPFGVNIPLLYSRIDETVDVVLRNKVPIVFSSAGNPATWTTKLRDGGVRVVHVVASAKFAEKAQRAGCDAVVAEGFEAGGHNGREETTTMVLVPSVRRAVDIPVIAAGGIATGRQMLAATALGASGVQVGSRFVCSEEASVHPAFKQAVVDSREGDTMLSLKKLVPVRLLRNKFFDEVSSLEARGASSDELSALLGKSRSRLGMFEGDMEEGELEIGQVAALIDRIQPAAEIVSDIWGEYLAARSEIRPS